MQLVRAVLGLVRILLLAIVLGLNPLILRATSDGFKVLPSD